MIMMSINDQEIKISEGMEVEFFGIVENSKGKMSDRAVHLQVRAVCLAGAHTIV